MTNIEKSIKLKKELDLLRPLKKEDELRIMQKFRLDWNYHSNNLEGNTLTYGETKALILFGITAQGKPLKDHFEVTGHDEAIKWVLEVIKQDRPLTENFIRELHKLILKEPYEVDAITPEGQPTKKRVNLGVYKTTPNHVKTKTGEIFRFATPEETPALMNDLVNWYNNKLVEEDINPILIAAEFHYRYIRIHPFDDGNGRTARILMNFILMQHGYPPVIINTNDKVNYFAVLRQADAGNINPFIEYIAHNLNHSLKIMLKGANGEDIEEPDDIIKEIALLEKKIKGEGQPIVITKNKERFIELINGFVFKLIEEFVEKGKLFERFYLNNKFELTIGGGGRYWSTEEALQNILNDIKEDTDEIWMRYYYYSFNKEGFQNENFFSHIEIEFDYSSYIVKTWRETIYQKNYGDFLTDKEIKELVNLEVKRHKQEIEGIIEKIDDKK